MTPEAQRIAIAEACGIQPKRMWRFWYDAEKTHGSICIPSRELAVEQALAVKNHHEAFGEEITTSEPEEYDEWEDVPDFLNDLNAIHEAIMALPPEQMVKFCEHLWDIIARDFGRHWKDFDVNYQTARLVFATAPQRCESFLRTLGKWVD